MLTTPPDLKAFLGKNISEICPFQLGKNNAQNHCAHFVSHVMGYDFGHTCKNFTLKDKQAVGAGANIRVDEIFNACPKTDVWDNTPFCPRASLIFVTISGNMRKLVDGRYFMDTGQNKHIGIYLDGQVWNYSNKQDKVVADPERLFFEKFKYSYRTAGNTVTFYYGDFLK